MFIKIIKVATLFVSLLVIVFMVFRVGDTDPDEMIKKYGANAHKVSDGIGGWIYYRDQGQSDGPVLLLVHGSNSSMQTWNGLIEQLSDTYRLISYDQHGHGLTGRHNNNDYSAVAKIEAGIAVLNAVGVEKAVWVGNSMGGWLTWRANLVHPERFIGMVLIDASGAQGIEKKEPYLGAKIASSSIGQLIAPYIMPRLLIEKSIKENYVDERKVTDVVIDQYWQLMRFPGNRRAISGIVNTSREPEKWVEISAWQAIKAPVLILWGEQDTVIPVSHAHEFHRKLASSTLVIYPDLAHIPMEEAPAEVAKDIHSWIDQLP